MGPGKAVPLLKLTLGRLFDHLHSFSVIISRPLNSALDEDMFMNEGMRFSLLYLDRSESLRDSKRFRNRLAAFYWETLHEYYKNEIVKSIQLEIGAEVPFIVSSYSVSEFFKITELRDLLDSITVIYKAIAGNWEQSANKWREFVARAISEENLGYRVDEKCGVHYFVDEEFERNRFSTLLVLDNPRYIAVRNAYDMAYQYLDAQPMDTKGAVRSIFEAIEILVKQMVDTKNLNKWVVENTLKEKCLSCYGSDNTAKIVMTKMFDGFALWVDSIHNYRHGQADKDPVVPPLNIAIYALSSGTAFLRWLIEMNVEKEKI